MNTKRTVVGGIEDSLLLRDIQTDIVSFSVTARSEMWGRPRRVEICSPLAASCCSFQTLGIQPQKQGGSR